MFKQALYQFMLSSIMAVFSYIPLSGLHTLGNLLGYIIWLLSPKARTTTLENVSRCFPEQSTHWKKKIARRSIQETIKSIVEAPWLWKQSPTKLQRLLQTQNQIDLIRAKSPNGSAILGTPHLGSWEFSGLWLATQRKLTILYRPPRLASLKSILNQGRSHTGAKLAPTSRKGVKMLHQALIQGDAIGILPDQIPKGTGKIKSIFFGQNAYTARLPVSLAQRHQCPVIFAFCERLPRGRGFKLHAIEANQDIYNLDIDIAIREMNRCLETLIKICPEQYLWAYRRFPRDTKMTSKQFN